MPLALLHNHRRAGMSSRRQSVSTALNDGQLDPFIAALWGFDGLPEALATVKQRDASISQAAQDIAAANSLETKTETVLNDAASSDAGSSATSQASSRPQVLFGAREMTGYTEWFRVC